MSDEVEQRLAELAQTEAKMMRDIALGRWDLSDDLDRQVEIIETLTQLGDKQAFIPVTRVLHFRWTWSWRKQQELRWQRQILARWLRRVSCSTVLNWLEFLSGREDDEWRRETAKCLKQASLEAIWTAWQHSKGRVRKWGLLALKEHAENYLELLLTALGDEDFGVREAAMQTLIGMGPSIADSLVPLLGDSEWKVRHRAEQILKRIAPAKLRQARQEEKHLARALSLVESPAPSAEPTGRELALAEGQPTEGTTGRELVVWEEVPEKAGQERRKTGQTDESRATQRNHQP